jgi:hypothetical protein
MYFDISLKSSCDVELIYKNNKERKKNKAQNSPP